MFLSMFSPSFLFQICMLLYKSNIKGEIQRIWSFHTVRADNDQRLKMMKKHNQSIFWSHAMLFCDLTDSRNIILIFLCTGLCIIVMILFFNGAFRIFLSFLDNLSCCWMNNKEMHDFFQFKQNMMWSKLDFFYEVN